MSRPHLREPVMALRDALMALLREGGTVRIDELVEDLTRTLSPDFRGYLASWGELSVRSSENDGGTAEFEARGPARRDRLVGVTVDVPPSLHGWMTTEGSDIVVHSDPGASPRVGLMGLRMRLSGMRVGPDGITASFGGGAFRVSVGF